MKPEEKPPSVSPGQTLYIVSVPLGKTELGLHEVKLASVGPKQVLVKPTSAMRYRSRFTRRELLHKLSLTPLDAWIRAARTAAEREREYSKKAKEQAYLCEQARCVIADLTDDK